MRARLRTQQYWRNTQARQTGPAPRRPVPYLPRMLRRMLRRMLSRMLSLLLAAALLALPLASLEAQVASAERAVADVLRRSPTSTAATLTLDFFARLAHIPSYLSIDN